MEKELREAVSKLIGIVTLEDKDNLELEVDTPIGPKLLTVKRTNYPNLRGGDIFRVELIRINRPIGGLKE